MNSIYEISKHVIRRFNRLYGPPTTPDREAYFAEYYKALSGTDPKILEEAIDAVVKRITIPAWPTPGACVEAVHEIAERRMFERRREAEPKQGECRLPTSEEKARVDALIVDLKGKLTAAGSRRLIKPREDWSRTTKPAWDERMATSEIAQELAIPRDLRRR